MKKVKEVCMLAGVSKRTLQYYDDAGVLPVERSDGNERLYSDEKLKKLSRILTYKKAGMKLEEIKEIIEMSEESQAQCLQQHIRKLTAKKGEIEEQINFARFIIREGVPDFSNVDAEGKSITYSGYLEEVMKQACRDSKISGKQIKHRRRR